MTQSPDHKSPSKNGQRSAADAEQGAGAATIQPASPNPALWQVQSFIQESQQKQDGGLNPVQLAQRIFRGMVKQTILLACILGIGFALLVFLIVKPVFESQGLVRITAREPKILSMDRDDSRLRLYDAFVSGEATYIQSQPVMRRAYDYYVEAAKERQQGTEGPADKVADYSGFTDSFDIKKVKGLIVIKSKNRQAAASQRAVNALLQAYTQLHLEQSGSRQTLRVRELEVRENELIQKQSQLNAALLNIGEEYDQSSLSKAHLAKVTQLEELDIRLDELSNSLAEMEATGGSIDADTGDMEIKRATLLDRAMADMVFQRAKLAAEKKKRLLRYQDNHPKVASLSASIGVIDKAIETRRQLIATLGKTGAITGGDGANKTQSMNELMALKKKLDTRRQDISKDAKRLNGKLIDLKRINQEKSVVGGMLAETRRVLDQLRLESRNSLPGTIEVLSRATLPEKPASDKRKQFGALAFMMGVGAALVLMVARYQFDSRIRYSDDLTKQLPANGFSAVLPADKGGADTGSENQPENYLGDQPEYRLSAPLLPFFNQLQLLPVWPRDRAVKICVTHFSAQDQTMIFNLAAVISNVGLRPLVIGCSDFGPLADDVPLPDEVRTALTAEEDNPKTGGLARYLMGAEEPVIQDLHGTAYIACQSRAGDAGYSLKMVDQWLQHFEDQYDVILVHAGVFERDFATQLLPHVCDLNIPVVPSQSKKRKVWRAFSQMHLVYPVFTQAAAGDPGIRQGQKDPTSDSLGDEHAQSAPISS